MTLGCKGCGKCCKYREDLLLTPFDIFRIAQYLSRAPEYIIERYCEKYIGPQSRIPIVRVMPVLPDASCPFLRGKKCSVHSVKPSTCRLFPFARVFEFDKENGTAKPPKYLLNSRCEEASALKTQKVRDWVGDAASDEAVAAAQLWSQCGYDWHHKALRAEKHWPKSTLEMFYGVLYAELYINYNTAEMFSAQFERNLKKACDVFDEIEKAIASFK